MTTNFSTGTTAKVVLIAPTNPRTPAKAGLAFVKRKLGLNNRLVLPPDGSQPPSLYVPFRLGAYTKPMDAVADLVKMGFKYVKGIHNVDTLLPPDKISTNLSTGVTTLVWVNSSIGLEQYAEASKVVGTITQNVTEVDKPTASLMSISVKDGVSTLSCVLVNGSPVFNTADPITLDVTIDTAVPSPYLSDNAVYTAYKFYSQYITSPKSTTSPELWLSVIPESNGDINASGTVSLVKPTAVVDLGEGAYNLTYPINADNLGLLPSTYLGNTAVTQGVVNATYQGYIISGSNCIISITGATGVFTADATITIELDASQSGFDYLGNEEISSYLLGYAEIHNTTELKNNYPVFDANIATLQSPDATKARKYLVKGYYGYAFKSIGEFKTIALTCPDTTMYKASLVFDVNTKYQEPTLGYGIAAQSMFMDLNSDYPYYESSGAGALINTPASTNKASWVKSDVINLATNQGWTVFVPNESGLHYVYRNVCTLQTVSSQEDLEYRFMSFQLKLRYYVKNSTENAEVTSTNPDGTRKDNDPELLSQLEINLKTLQSTLDGSNPQVKPILGKNHSVTVGLNPADVTRTLITEVISIVSGNSGNDITVNVQPYTI